MEFEEKEYLTHTIQLYSMLTYHAWHSHY